MDVKQLLIDALITNYKFPIYLQGSMSDKKKYPDSFFTFWNNDSPGEAFYNNNPARTIWDFDLNFYSNNPALVNAKLVDVKKELKKIGFIIDGKGYDVISDEPTHTGRGINLVYVEESEDL